MRELSWNVYYKKKRGLSGHSHHKIQSVHVTYVRILADWFWAARIDGIGSKRVTAAQTELLNIIINDISEG